MAGRHSTLPPAGDRLALQPKSSPVTSVLFCQYDRTSPGVWSVTPNDCTSQYNTDTRQQTGHAQRTS